MPSPQLETRNQKLETDLRDLAQDIVRRAMNLGAAAAECVIREGDEFSTLVRLGQVETLKESGSKAIGVRVFNGKRAASTYSSDFSRESLDRMLTSALDLSRITSEDPYASIPEPEQLGSIGGDLDLYSADVYSLPGQERIAYARRAEKAALDYDPRIKNSEGGSFDAATGHKVLANSHGFVGEYRRSYCSVVAVPIAQSDNGAMQRDYWYSVARSLSRLESPEDVGKTAALRTLRRLGARKVKTAHVPVVLENGVLKSYLLNSYTAKKLGLQTTANASRGLAGTPGISPGNYFLQPGSKTPQQIIGEIKEGLYVTEFLGHGVNLVTGDYSRGASGLWISGGELAYPVEEITVAGNLKEIFFNISEIGNDLEFRGAVACPTIRIDGLTVGGE